jgi:hypothetical protein
VVHIVTILLLIVNENEVVHIVTILLLIVNENEVVHIVTTLWYLRKKTDSDVIGYSTY